jgi:pimeloyl-ACP methyl ester carboxylesterase
MPDQEVKPLAHDSSRSFVLREPDRAELVEVDRTILRLWCWGDVTAPPVLLLHGAYDHGRMFDDLAPRVAALGYHAIALDFRGHGDSGPLDTGFAWALLHLDLALLVRDVVGTPVGVVAHSFGGGQAIGLAGAFPELVRWLVVIDGLGPPSDALVPPDDIRAAIRTSAARTDRILFDRHRREWTSLEDMAAHRRSLNPRLSPAWADHLARHGARRGPDGGWVWKADPMFGLGVPSEFNVELLAEEQRRVQCPVLVITGTEHDTWRDLTPEQEAERVGWLRGHHVTVPNTGHYVHLEDPEATTAAIRAFVDEVEHDRRTAPRPR